MLLAGVHSRVRAVPAGLEAARAACPSAPAFTAPDAARRCEGVARSRSFYPAGRRQTPESSDKPLARLKIEGVASDGLRDMDALTPPQADSSNRLIHRDLSRFSPSNPGAAGMLNSLTGLFSTDVAMASRCDSPSPRAC